MSHTTSSERGFTLAGVLVIMTVIAIMVAYTVPHQWSIAMKRDREKQTMLYHQLASRGLSEMARKLGARP